jgi:hypothetical protein
MHVLGCTVHPEDIHNTASCFHRLQQQHRVACVMPYKAIGPKSELFGA